MPRHPEIAIGYGFQLESIFKKLFESGKKKEDETFPTAKDFWSRYGRLPAAWRAVERDVLDAMCDALDLEFRQPAIEAYMAYTGHSLSNPMIVGVRYANDDRFIDQLTQELARRLLNDNTRRIPTAKILKEMFPDAAMSNATRSAILVHAVQELILREVLEAPTRVEKHVESARTYPDYAASWEIVLERGYRPLLEDFKAKAIAHEAAQEEKEPVAEVMA